MYNDIANSRNEKLLGVKFDSKLTFDDTMSLSRHEQVCVMRLRFERYFSHHRAM